MIDELGIARLPDFSAVSSPRARLIRVTGNHPYAVGIAGTLAAIVVIAAPLVVVAGDREQVIAHAR